MTEERGRGWGALFGLVLATVVLSVVNPALLIVVPLSLLLVALPPHRPRRVIAGALLAGIALAGAGTAPSGLWYVERAWPLILGGWFLLGVVLLPRSAFLPRAMGAVAASAVTAAAVLEIAGGWRALDRTFRERFDAGVADALRAWGGQLEGTAGVRQAMEQAAALQAFLYPALLALASMAALAITWWVYRRVAGQESRPLARLREFRFSDHLVWVVVAGALLMLLPAGDAGMRTGSNLLTFMAALYALRGLAVVVALIGSPGWGMVLLGTVAALLLYPLVLMATLVVGLTDTWLDLRSARGAGRRKS
ncbi:MAG TPA: DUF2232 domain-containing protein [Longimicrobiales bacterium]|nr:DUF2232 domain-containing protein [Longimicrobiales bacterium]